jgi:hypothetical protein
VERRELAEEDRALALTTLERALDRDDASDQVFVEISGQIVPTGTYAEAGRRLLTRLSAGESPLVLHTEQQRLLLTVNDDAGNPMEFVVSIGIDGVASLISSQSSYYSVAEGRLTPGPLHGAYEKVRKATQSLQVPFELMMEVLQAVLQEVATRS